MGVGEKDAWRDARTLEESLTYHLENDPIQPCDAEESPCVGSSCPWFRSCWRDERDAIVCDDDCKECPESGPLPECLR